MLVPKIQLEKRGAEADAKGMVFALRHVTSFQYSQQFIAWTLGMLDNSEVIFPSKSGALLLSFPCFCWMKVCVFQVEMQLFVPFMYIP